MSNQQALAKFTEAREHFRDERFRDARAAIADYRNAIDYKSFHHIDQRTTEMPIVSVVIVAYGTGLELLKCIQSVLGQNEIVSEVILVDHGGNEHLQQQLAKLSILHITPPINLLPSEGRNLGAHFARGELIAFLDDDAIMSPRYLAAAVKAMKDQSLMALRGRVLPKNGKTKSPQHYDLGDTPLPAELNLEGNLVIRKRVFEEAGGFDPLMFGHEGKELTLRCRQHFPDKTIHYQPELLIRHDYAESDNLIAKRERQVLGGRYIQHKKEHPLTFTGLSILVRAGDDLPAANAFLASLARHNTYKPIEVLLWSKDAKQAVAHIRPYIAQFFVRVLPAGIKSLGHVGQQARYESLCIVDMPTVLKSAELANLFKRQQANLATVLPCDTKRILPLADTLIDIPLAEIAKQIGSAIPKTTLKPRTPVPKATKGTSSKKSEQGKKLPTKVQDNQTATENACSVQVKADLAARIKQAEEQIKQLETQLTKTEEIIAGLESQYLPLPESSSEKQSLRNQLEEKVLTSCSLLVELKDAHDNLQELRIRSLCGA